MTSQFAGYRIVETLHATSRSLVERAVRASDGTAVVLKRAADGCVVAEALRRALYEHDVLARLRGDGVIAACELVRDGSRIALVLESFGDALARRMATGRIPLDEALAIAVEVARALDRIHAAGIVHKDINPYNIVYDPEARRAKVIDFDISCRSRSASPEFVAPVALEGTLRYMAPEQTGRLNRTIDARTDIYSFGATLYELFGGQPPFDGDDALALVHAHLAEQPPPLVGVPGAIVEIIDKAMAKAPEQRYQTAAAMAADLERCARTLTEHGRIDPFPIGVEVSTRFEFADKLYGRDAEVRALLDAFARVATGSAEAVAVSGPPGVGKSSIVREVYAPVTLQRGYFASGKFEQLRGDVPYSAVVAALGDLLAQVLADRELDRWRSAIAEAVADDAALVATVVPAIERVIGRDGSPSVLDPSVAQRRLALALMRVVGVFARKQHPLVLFLDDMQWADGASLQLLTRLLTSAHVESLLVIEAYRDNETGPSHPFTVALRDAEKHGAIVSRIEVAALRLEETIDLVAETMHREPSEIESAAGVIWRKTEGNPLFVRQFMQLLHDEGFIAFDPATRSFTLDGAAIDAAAVTENIAELLARQLGKLPAATRDLLAIAAAIGSRFELDLLASVATMRPAVVHDALAPAVDAGLILPIATLEHIDTTETGAVIGSPRYAFRHDHIQAAAYDASSGREQLHLAIGRRVLASATVDDLAMRPFEIVHHLSLGLSAMSDDTERARFVELALVAARHARRAGAFDVAAKLLRAIRTCRDATHHHAVWIDASYELAEVLALDGGHRDAREIIRAAVAVASPRDRAKLESLDVVVCISLGHMAEAVACGRRAAALLGVELPANPGALGAQIEAEIGIVMAAAAHGPVASWIDRPEMTDPDTLDAMRVLANCIPAAYQIEPPLMVLIVAKLVTLSLRHGNCGESARGYAAFSIVLWVMKQYEACFAFGKLGMDLIARFGGHPQQAAIEFTYAAFAAPWKLPLQEAIERLTATRASDVIEITHLGYATLFRAVYREIHGAPLPELIEQIRSDRKLCARFGMRDIDAWLSALLAHARWWAGVPAAPGENELEFAAVDRALVDANASQSMIVSLRILEIERRYWRGDHLGVGELAAAVRPMVTSIPANPYTAELCLYACLAALAIGTPRAEIEADRAALAGYARACPANFGHMAALVDAELARVDGDVATAIASYDAAIEGAAANDFVKVETIAHELAAGFWLAHGKPAFAAVHLGKARELCEHRGALPRARELELRRRGLGASHDHHATRSSTAIASTLDFATIVKANAALASDIVLDSLLVKIVDIIVENTGAQSGSIILATGGSLLLHASKRHGAAATITGGIPLTGAVSEAIVTYVTRTAEWVVLADATRHRTFRSDPYVRERQPRSVLCMPIVHKERMIGAVYLENNLVAGAFTVERLEALGILVAQLAVSIENALLFTHLEELVAQRTRALTEANAQLREQAVVRARMESELRLGQKLQSVGQLAAGVAHEINTPIQFIGDSIRFVREALDAMLGLVDVYRGSPDPEAIAAAEDAADLGYLRSNAPEACVRALDGVERVSKIVGAMKAFSHPDHEQQGPTELNTEIETTLVVARSEYRDVADIVTDFAELPLVTCHAGEINQVLLNLIVNAAHAIGDVFATTRKRGAITIRTRVEGGAVVIEVEDTGSGIPDGVRDRVFDPFFTTKPVGRGTGQGLALAHTAIVDRHGGSLTFTSRVGEGTTFYVRLPIDGAAIPAKAS